MFQYIQQYLTVSLLWGARYLQSFKIIFNPNT